MPLNQVDISMMEDIPAPGVAGKIIISDGTNWTSGENAPSGSIVKQATDPTPTDPATPTLGDMILNNTTGQLFSCTDATAGAAVWIETVVGDTILTSKLSGAVTSIASHGLGTLATLSTVDSAQIEDDSITGSKLNPPLVAGDIIYADGTDTINRLAKPGTPAGEVLTFATSATAPSWVAAAGGLDVVASDPGSPSIGDQWFNTTTNTHKIQATGAVTPGWSTGTNGTAMKFNGGAGSRTDSWWSGGETDSNGTANVITHLYNGTSWSTGGSLPNQQSRGPGCCGVSSAGFMYGGGGSWSTAYYLHEYNGGAWTQVGSSAAGGEQAGDNCCGLQTAALYLGGYNPSGVGNNNARLWNGSAESAGGAWNHGTTSHACMAGTSTASISVMGMSGGSNIKSAETYNGSSWSTITDPSMTAVQRARMGGITQTTAHLFGGTTSTHSWQSTSHSGSGSCQNAHMSWNGSSWTTQAVMLTAREFGGAMPGAAGGSGFGITSGGTTSGATNTTEIYTAGSGVYSVSMSAE